MAVHSVVVMVSRFLEHLASVVAPLVLVLPEDSVLVLEPVASELLALVPQVPVTLVPEPVASELLA